MGTGVVDGGGARTFLVMDSKESAILKIQGATAAPGRPGGSRRLDPAYVFLKPGLFMARSYVRQNVVNRFELQPRSDERSYDSLFTQIST